MSIIYLVFIYLPAPDCQSAFGPQLRKRHVHGLDTCSSRNSTFEMTSILWCIVARSTARAAARAMHFCRCFGAICSTWPRNCWPVYDIATFVVCNSSIGLSNSFVYFHSNFLVLKHCARFYWGPQDLNRLLKISHCSDYK